VIEVKKRSKRASKNKSTWTNFQIKKNQSQPKPIDSPKNCCAKNIAYHPKIKQRDLHKQKLYLYPPKRNKSLLMIQMQSKSKYRAQAKRQSNLTKTIDNICVSIDKHSNIIIDEKQQNIKIEWQRFPLNTTL